MDKENYVIPNRTIPENYKNKDIEICLGIDEAGRGPVLGPMVYGCAYYPFLDDQNLKKKYGFDDSKKLTDPKRQKIFDRMMNSDDLFYDVEIIMPQDISNKMLRRSKYNLNTISNDAALDLLNRRLKDNINITKVIKIVKTYIIRYLLILLVSHLIIRHYSKNIILQIITELKLNTLLNQKLIQLIHLFQQLQLQQK